LGEKIARHQANVWLINTGWTGGAYGVGSRLSLPYTRAMIRSVLNGSLQGVPMYKDRNFGIAVPEAVPDVPSEVLHPRHTWADRLAYDQQVQLLIGKFQENFTQFAGQVSPEVNAAGPVTHSS
jgi:phosphoenolpyruvate carboxykinase (ATP)